jgi:formyl-CoA transferase
MQEAITYYMRTRIAFGADWGRAATPRTGNNVGAAPTGLYPCKPFGPNDWAFVITVTRPHIDRFFLAIDRPDLLTDERFSTEEARVANSDLLREEITLWTREHTKREVMQHLGDAGIPCSATFDTADLFDDPHLNERGFVHHLEHPTEGDVRLLGFPSRMSASEVSIEPAPALGEHTGSVLSQELGLDTEELKRLDESGAIALGQPR